MERILAQNRILVMRWVEVLGPDEATVVAVADAGRDITGIPAFS